MRIRQESVLLISYHCNHAAFEIPPPSLPPSLPPPHTHVHRRCIQEGFLKVLFFHSPTSCAGHPPRGGGAWQGPGAGGGATHAQRRALGAGTAAGAGIIVHLLRGEGGREGGGRERRERGREGGREGGRRLGTATQKYSQQVALL